MEKELPGAGMEGYIRNGLEKMTKDVLGRVYLRDDGAEFKVARCMIDANWAQTKDVIYRFCKESNHAGIVMPSHGTYYGARGGQFGTTKKKPGERRGLRWSIPKLGGTGPIRYASFDTNFWKSFVAARLKTAIGDVGAMQLFGKRGAIGKKAHALFFEHLLAERPVRVEAKGRVCNEWELPDKNRDNHWFDCLVGCAVAASIEGAVLPGTEVGGKKRRRRRVLLPSEVRERRAKR